MSRVTLVLLLSTTVVIAQEVHSPKKLANDYRPIIGEDGKTLIAVRGVWRTRGYGT